MSEWQTVQTSVNAANGSLSSAVQPARVCQYVVHHHTGYGEPHFDLMIDLGGEGLATWRVATWPPDRDTLFEPIAEHRRAYLDYEGPTASGRGEVRRVERGTCEVRARRVRFQETWHDLGGPAGPV